MNDSLRKYLAEFIGTFALVFAGTGAIVVNVQTGALGNAGIALVFGFIVAVMVYLIGHISGAHINPAVTLSFYAGKKLNKKHVLPYIISQLLGASLASILVLITFGKDAFLGATLPTNGFFMLSFFLEIILTFFLMFVILGTASNYYKKFSGLAIGTTVGLGSFFGGPISGASMNPARSFGPALISGNFSYHWVYWIAPIIGALLAVYAYKFIDAKRCKI